MRLPRHHFCRILPILGCAILSLSFASQSYGDRLLSTAEGEMVEPHEFELEACYGRALAGIKSEQQLFAAELDYGLANWINVGLDLPFSIGPKGNRRDEGIEIETKFLLSKERRFLPGAALRLTGDVDGEEFAFKGILTKTIANVRLDFNGGYAATPLSVWTGTRLASLAAYWYLHPRIALIGETAAELAKNNSGGHVLIGTAVKTFGGFEPTIAVQKEVGMNSAGKWGLRAGFTQEF